MMPSTLRDSGYATHDRVFRREETDRVLDALSRAEVWRSKAGARHLFVVPVVRELANDQRLMDLAAHYLGRDPTPFRATLFDKSPGANWLVAWHQDTALPLSARIDDPEWGPWSTKAGVLYAHAPAWALERVIALRFSLDDSTPSNGPLRVLPGTHRDGVLSHEQIERLSRANVPVDCVTAAGGVVMMRPLTVHASSKSSDDRARRVVHIEYAASIDLGRGIPLAVG